MSHHSITQGLEVIYQGVTFSVRAVDGNVLALEASDGSFARHVHVSSVMVCEPPAIQTTSPNLPVPDVGQEVSGDDIFLWPCGARCFKHDAHNFDWKSDDYELLAVESDEWNDFLARQEVFA